MFLLIENGKIIAEEECLGNACEHQMVLNECGRNVIVLDEDEFWDQQAMIAEMADAHENGMTLWQ